MNPKERWDEVFKQGKDFTTLNVIFLDEELLPLLTPHSGDTPRTFFDIGCGTGDALTKMQERGFTVNGIDVSAEAVRIAREKTGLSKEIIVGDIDTGALNEFESNKYDLISVKLVIAFIKDKQSFLKNVQRLLKEDGQLLLVTPLLYPGIEYVKPNTKGIAVEAETIDVLLKESFSQVDLFHKDYLDDNGVLGYYLCSK